MKNRSSLKDYHIFYDSLKHTHHSGVQSIAMDTGRGMGLGQKEPEVLFKVKVTKNTIDISKIARPFSLLQEVLVTNPHHTDINNKQHK